MTAPGDCLRTTDDETRRPVRSLPPSKPLTGPAPPRRSVCAPGRGPGRWTADHLFEEMPTMLFRSLLRYAGYGQQTASRRRPARQRPRARLSLEALEDRTLPSTFVVDRLTDTGAGAGLAGDLRYCLGQANANPGDDAITFSVTGTINLAGALPNLSSNIDLQGPGAG